MVNWEIPLFGCLGDLCSCIVVGALPGGACIYQGMSVSKATGESCTIACCCVCLLACLGAAYNRGKIRDRYLINGSFCGDCITNMFCLPCAVCQEYREVNVREAR